MLQTSLVLKDVSLVTLGEAFSRRLPSEQVSTYMNFKLVKEEGLKALSAPRKQLNNSTAANGAQGGRAHPELAAELGSAVHMMLALEA